MTEAAWLQAAATVVLVGITWWYAKSARESVKEARGTANATREAAASAAAAATSAERQVALMEREAARREFEEMPLLWARSQALNLNSGNVQVQLGNSGRLPALDVSLAVIEGQLAGDYVKVRRPILDDPHQQEEALQFPTKPVPSDATFKIEGRYRDSRGNRWAVQCSSSGDTKYFRIVSVGDDGPVTFEPLGPGDLF